MVGFTVLNPNSQLTVKSISCPKIAELSSQMVMAIQCIGDNQPMDNYYLNALANYKIFPQDFGKDSLWLF